MLARIYMIFPFNNDITLTMGLRNTSFGCLSGVPCAGLSARHAGITGSVPPAGSGEGSHQSYLNSL